MRAPLRKLIDAVADMTDEDWDVLAEIFKAIVEARTQLQQDDPETPSPIPATPPPDEL